MLAPTRVELNTLADPPLNLSFTWARGRRVAFGGGACNPDMLHAWQGDEIIVFPGLREWYQTLLQYIPLDCIMEQLTIFKQPSPHHLCLQDNTIAMVGHRTALPLQSYYIHYFAIIAYIHRTL